MLVDPRHPHVNESADLIWVPDLSNPAILKRETLARLEPIVEAELRGIRTSRTKAIANPPARRGC